MTYTNDNSRSECPCCGAPTYPLTVDGLTFAPYCAACQREYQADLERRENIRARGTVESCYPDGY